MSRNKLATWAVLAAFIISALPTVWAEGSSDEWFYGTPEDDYELEDRDNDGYDDHIIIGYDPDTNVSDYVDITVRIWVYDEGGSQTDFLSENHTIYGSGLDSFTQSWSPTTNGTYTFEAELWDDENFLEDNYTIEDIELYVCSGSDCDDEYNEWFYSIDNTVSDEDADGYDDTATIDYDPDTTCSCDINITVEIKVYDNQTGVHLDTNDYEYTINGGGWDSFSEAWSPDYNGTFDFFVDLYDDMGNHEDEEEFLDVELHAMSGSADETINVENAVLNGDDDALMNDLAFWAHVEDNDEEGINITVWKKNVFGQWEFFDNGTTNEDGELEFKNVTSGEYMWSASVDGEELVHEGGYAVVDSTYTTGHIAVLEDWDDADDWDDFVVQVPEGNSSKDDAYVEIYDEDGIMVDNGTTDDESWGDYFFISSDLEKGNYTHYIYEEEDGDLLQNGSFHSYGSTSTNTNYDEWFEDWDYKTEDTNDDNTDDTIEIEYDPDTDCDCEVNITVYLDVYENETGDWVDWTYAYHTINGTQVDDFAQNWTAEENGTYDFQVRLYDDDYNLEDEFWIRGVTLNGSSGGGGGGGDEDEWFYSHNHETEDTNGDGEVDTIEISYDPDTTCDCDVDITVYILVYDNETGDLVDWDTFEYTINDGSWDSFSETWTAYDDGTYDFQVDLYDEEDNYEDNFTITGIELSAGDEGGFNQEGGGGGDEDEWFDSWYYETEDTNEDDEDDTIEIGYEPDTTCDCDVDIKVYIWVYETETGDLVDWQTFAYTINGGKLDSFSENWTAYDDGTYDFVVDLYDDDDNYEDGFNITSVELSAGDEGGFNQEGGEDDYEWFKEGDYHTDDLTIDISYDPDTSCDCDVDIKVEIDVYENETGDLVDDSNFAEHTIYGDESGWFMQDWTADEEGTYDFKVWLFDEDNNLEDEFEINGVELAEQNAAPVIDALYVDDGDEGEELSFSVSAHDDDDDDLTYAWDFGDGETDSGESVSHTYADNDDYTVMVTVSDGDAEDTDSATVEIANLAPTLSVDGPGSGSEGQERSFEADTNDVEADTVSVTWDFGDGETATGDVVSHTWSDDDSYTVVVIASDEDGDETVEMVTITINNLAPTLQISSSSISGDEGDTFTFTATVSDVPADPISVTWDFDDGQTGDGTAVTHTFTDQELYLVEATATDGDGGIVTKTLYIDVANVVPELSGLQLPTSVKEGEQFTVSITATDPGDDEVTITWNWGDGETDKGASTSHTYDRAGTFVVTICAEDEDGGADCMQSPPLSVEALEELDEGGALESLPGFGLLAAFGAFCLLATSRRH